MTAQQIIFLILSILTLGSGFAVVTNKNLFHAALALMVTFLGVAGFYVMLDAGFMAAAQLMVYIGAISILIIFAIMMTRRLMQTKEPSFNSQVGLGFFGAVATFGMLAFVILRYEPFNTTLPTGVSVDTLSQSVEALGRALVSSDAYVIPFEVTSIMLLAALVGAIVIAWPKSEDTA